MKKDQAKPKSYVQPFPQYFGYLERGFPALGTEKNEQRIGNRKCFLQGFKHIGI